MARRPRQARVQELSAQQHFGKKLVLNQWLLSRFGIDPLQQFRDNGQRVRPIQVLAKSLRHAPAGLDATRHHHYLHALLGQWQPSWRYSEEQLKRFDAHIVAHTDALNRLRQRQPVQWKYFQWLTLLFVEIYLHEYCSDRHGLLDSLNQQVERFNEFWNGLGWQTGISPYQLEELNKLCLQNATGSGKTLLMHTNIRQFRHYADVTGKAREYGQIILVTPNERLTEQHQREFSESGLESERLAQDSGDLFSGERKALGRIAVTEITKLALEQGRKTMAVESFGDANLLLVDEGHRGLGSASEEKGWLAHRQRLAGRGFTFEYSATFKEAVVAAKDAEVEQSYAKAILFDYGYRYFYEDGYGKDYRIFNLPERLEQHQRNYLTAALVAFWQQRRLYDDRQREFRPYNLSSPLWVFVGASVVKDDGKKESAANYRERASDVAQILGFLAWFAAEREEAVAALEATVFGNAKGAGLVDAEGNDIFAGSFPYLQELKLDVEALYADILQRVFRSSGGTLVVDRITGDSGELLLKIGDTPFGLINVGDAPGLAEHLEKAKLPHVEVRKAEFASPMFAEVHLDSSPVNVLIGSKKFIEGWNCWRVSSMGLMNTGKKEGSQIIQLFGRGVRLMGKGMSLMRSSRLEPATAPKHIHLLETLNVFGVGADFMATFRDFLKEEGLPGNDQPEVFTVKLNVTADVGKQLKILRPKVRKDTHQQYSFTRHGPLVRLGGVGADLGLPPDIASKNRKIVLDRYPRLEALQADGVSLSQAAPVQAVVHTAVFDELRLVFLDMDRLYLDLARYIQQRGYANLLLDHARLALLLRSADWYELRIPPVLWELKAANFRLWQQLALELLSLLADRVFNHHKRAYLEPRLELVKLSEADGNLPSEPEYRLLVDGSESALVDDIRELKKTFESDGGDHFDSGRESVAGARLGIHLYSPLLSARSNRIRIEPVGLNDSEFRFVVDLKRWLQRNQARLEHSGERLYLLRNLVRHGVGFFEAGGFWPDFILWRLHEGKQRIVFVDPHGLQHEGQGSEKIDFHQRIKQIEQRLKDPSIALESVILSPPRTSRSEIGSRWRLSDEELAMRHVFFMADPGYLDQLMGIVRGASPSAHADMPVKPVPSISSS